MKKIIIRIIGLNCIDLNKTIIKIYNSNKKNVYKGITKNGIVNLSLNNNEAYKVCIFSSIETISTSILVTNNCNEYIILASNNKYYKSTFLLTDANYLGLPIEKGEIILWQK